MRLQQEGKWEDNTSFAPSMEILASDPDAKPFNGRNGILQVSGREGLLVDGSTGNPVVAPKPSFRPHSL